MKLILLPGNSPKNKPWIDDLANRLSPLFSSSYTHYYQHWLGKAQNLNSQKELTLLSSQLTLPYAIFAKSAGVSLTLQGISQNLLQPKFCIFVGIAAKLSSSKTKQLLQNLTLPTLFIQQENDFFNKAKNLQQTLKQLNLPNATLHIIPGNDHMYSNLEEYLPQLQSFIKNNLTT